MKRLFFLLAVLGLGLTTQAQLTVKKVARNAVRVQYQERETTDTLPDWLYVKHDETDQWDLQVETDAQAKALTIRDQDGRQLFKALRHELQDGGAMLVFDSP